jgi:hypothetical protein
MFHQSWIMAFFSFYLMFVLPFFISLWCIIAESTWQYTLTNLTVRKGNTTTTTNNNYYLDIIQLSKILNSLISIAILKIFFMKEYIELYCKFLKDEEEYFALYITTKTDQNILPWPCPASPHKVPLHKIGPIVRLVFFVVLGLELGLTLARHMHYHLSHSSRPILCWVFSR